MGVRFSAAYDIWFRPVFAFFIVDVNTERVVHVAATRAPTARGTGRIMSVPVLGGLHHDYRAAA